MIQDDYAERVYAGWLGKAIGVRHGGNVEGWTYEKLERAYGEITGYLHEFKHFAADDDTNGPIFFVRALEDYTHASSELTAEQIGKTWLNYVPDGHGFFWWGGYGHSTEHTAYLNMKAGIAAPLSGSIAQNGAAVAEQIGGQIFSDAWGLIAPGKPRLAAEYARKAASVSHDGNGVYGGMFIAACIAQAFAGGTAVSWIEAGLAVIPADSEYARMVRAVTAYRDEHSEADWRACFRFVREHFGYDRYPGACHIIPNAAVIVLSMLYGEGDFSKTINICNMCGWDTDCNVGNVGAILGVRVGLEGIADSWRLPINDFLCCSSVIGSLNMLDMPWCASYIAKFGYRIEGEAPPLRWRTILEDEATLLHFEYPGSTHGFAVSHTAEGHVTTKLSNTTEAAASGSRSLKVMFDGTLPGEAYRLFHRTYYLPEDFNDGRYDPAFSPKLYPGQTVEAVLKLHPAAGDAEVKARLYVRDRNGGGRHYGDPVVLSANEWSLLTYRIPAMANACLIEVGIELVRTEGGWRELIVYLDRMRWSGAPDYRADFAGETVEHWHGRHREISQFTHLRGIWTFEDGQLSGRFCGETAECYTGMPDWKDVRFHACLTPRHGDDHRILFRVQGAIRSYAAGLAPGNRVVLYKNDLGYKELAAAACEWQAGREYAIEIDAAGNRFVVRVDGQALIDYTDTDRPYLRGMIGFCNGGGSHTLYRSYEVKGLS